MSDEGNTFQWHIPRTPERFPRQKTCTYIVACLKRHRQSFRASVWAPSCRQSRTSTNPDDTCSRRTCLESSVDPLSYIYTCNHMVKSHRPRARISSRKALLYSIEKKPQLRQHINIESEKFERPSYSTPTDGFARPQMSKAWRTSHQSAAENPNVPHDHEEMQIKKGVKRYSLPSTGGVRRD